MDEKHEQERPDSANDTALECVVYEALKCLGWAVPDSADDVRRAEAELSESPTPMPESLQDAAAVFEGKAAGGMANVSLTALGPDAQVEENLAQAAREGGKIPPEIEEQMRRDRLAAEQQLEEDQDGGDVG